MGLRYGNYKRLLLCGHPILIYQQTFSACMFCFPISDHVMVLQRTVSFKYHLIHVAALVCLIYEWTKAKFPGEHHMVWILDKQNIQAKKVYCMIMFRIISFWVWSWPLKINVQQVLKQNSYWERHIFWKWERDIRKKLHWLPDGLEPTACMYS